MSEGTDSQSLPIIDNKLLGMRQPATLASRAQDFLRVQDAAADLSSYLPKMFASNFRPKLKVQSESAVVRAF
jgi:hypothetical protein